MNRASSSGKSCNWKNTNQTRLENFLTRVGHSQYNLLMDWLATWVSQNSSFFIGFWISSTHPHLSYLPETPNTAVFCLRLFQLEDEPKSLDKRWLEITKHPSIKKWLALGYQVHICIIEGSTRPPQTPPFDRRMGRPRSIPWRCDVKNRRFWILAGTKHGG